jgi:lipoprotein NlpI
MFTICFSQLGLYHTEQREYQSAIESFAKSLIMKPDYPSAVINLSIVYFKLDQIDMAHGLLNGLTQANGWDVPEAFLWLARVCERQERKLRAQELLRYALVLERTRCCRELGKVVGRWV